jgi:ATP-binding cassette subfamily F protein uup
LQKNRGDAAGSPHGVANPAGGANAVNRGLPSSASGATADSTKPVRKAKLSYKDQRELEALPGHIAGLEAEQKALNAQLEDGTLYATKPHDAAAMAARLAAIDDELLVLLERWEALEALQGGAS